MGTECQHAKARKGLRMAGRIPKPWYREGKGEGCVYLHGKLHRLGKDKEKAFREFHRLMAKGGEKPEPVADTALTVRQVVDDYLADLGRRATARTAYVARCYLKPLLAECGTMPARQLRKHHVEAVVRKHGGGTPRPKTTSRAGSWPSSIGRLHKNCCRPTPSRACRSPRRGAGGRRPSK